MNVSATYHIAHMNFAVLRHGWDDQRSAGFVDNLDAVNAVAVRAPGFVWRLEEFETPKNDPDLVFGANPGNAVTLSVWESARALENFVKRAIHGGFLKRRAEWFLDIDRPSYVLWPVPAGHVPTLVAGKAMLDRLAVGRPSEDVFDFSCKSRKCSGTEAA